MSYYIATTLNVRFQEAIEGVEATEVAALDPVSTTQAIDTPDLQQAAREVRGRLEQVVHSLQVAH